MKIEQEVKKAVEQLTAGEKIQLELDKKNQVLKIWKLKLDRIDLRSKEFKE
jgi:type III secretory pathway component EscV